MKVQTEESTRGKKLNYCSDKINKCINKLIIGKKRKGRRRIIRREQRRGERLCIDEDEGNRVTN